MYCMTPRTLTLNRCTVVQNAKTLSWSILMSSFLSLNRVFIVCPSFAAKALFRAVNTSKILSGIFYPMWVERCQLSCLYAGLGWTEKKGTPHIIVQCMSQSSALIVWSPASMHSVEYRNIFTVTFCWIAVNCSHFVLQMSIQPHNLRGMKSPHSIGTSILHISHYIYSDICGDFLASLKKGV